MSAADVASGLERDGFALVHRLFDAAAVTQLIDSLSAGESDRSMRAGETYGARNLLSLEAVDAVTKSAALRAVFVPMLGDEIQAVRAIFFDKTPSANWPVAWHQDLSVALQERREVPGWTNWTIKRGVAHAQAPDDVLASMITARIHLDDCPTDNGPLRVIAGSHLRGVLSRHQIASIGERERSIEIVAKAGDTLLMRPLLLHASSRAQIPRHRRILHLEFAAANLLPKELNWADSA